MQLCFEMQILKIFTLDSLRNNQNSSKIREIININFFSLFIVLKIYLVRWDGPQTIKDQIDVTLGWI